MVQNPFNGIESLVCLLSFPIRLLSFPESIQWNWKYTINGGYLWHAWPGNPFNGIESPYGNHVRYTMEIRIHSMELKAWFNLTLPFTQLHPRIHSMELKEGTSSNIVVEGNIVRIHSMELKVYYSRGENRIRYTWIHSMELKASVIPDTT